MLRRGQSWPSPTNFVDVNWANGHDANGRPIEVPEAVRINDWPRDSIPGGAHNWHPMSFNTETGLVYLPPQNIPLRLMDYKGWKHNANVSGAPHSAMGWNTAMYRNDGPPKRRRLGG
jgi:quinohemoprotein ethanol dehydrogenase